MGWTIARTILIGPPMMLVGVPAKQAFLGAAVGSTMISLFTLLRLFDARNTGLAGIKNHRRRTTARRPGLARRPTRRR